MLKNSIKLTDDTKSLIDEIKNKFDLKTYDSSIKTAVLFILRNEINLREDYIGDYRKGLVDLENRLIANFQIHEDKIIGNYASLRKWVGGIEKDYLKPLTAKLDTLDKLGDLGFNKILVDKLNAPKIENPLNSNIKSEVKESENIEEPKKDVQNRDEKFKEIYDKYEKQKQALFKIFNNSKVEAGGMISKERITVNLSAEEWEELKNLS